AFGHGALLLHQSGQQTLGRLGVASALDDLVKHVSVLINGAPQPVLLASDADNHFIQMPDVMRTSLLAAQPPGIGRSKLFTPAPDRLVRDDDSTLEQHLLDKSEAQWKSEVQPNCMGNDLGRKS